MAECSSTCTETDLGLERLLNPDVAWIDFPGDRRSSPLSVVANRNLLTECPGTAPGGQISLFLSKWVIASGSDLITAPKLSCQTPLHQIDGERMLLSVCRDTHILTAARQEADGRGGGPYANLTHTP